MNKEQNVEEQIIIGKIAEIHGNFLWTFPVLTSSCVSSASKALESRVLKYQPGTGMEQSVPWMFGLQGHWPLGELWSQTWPVDPPTLQSQGRQPELTS